jgi:membrane protein
MARNNYSRLGKILSGADSDTDEQIFQLESRLERFAHFWVLVARQFVRHRCLVRASALSFSTLLALIPLLAVVASIASSLLKGQDEKQFTQAIEQMVARLAPAAKISTNAPGLEHYFNDETGWATNLTSAADVLTAAPAIAVDTQKEIAAQIHKYVENTSSGALGVTGLIFLILTTISLLRGIEETFNDIWGVTRGRSWLMQILLYWTIPTLGSVLLATALGLANGAHFQRTRDLLENASHFSFVSEHLLPVLILSLALAVFYKLMPNTKVEMRAALLGGFFAGTAWHLYNQLGFLLGSHVRNVGAIYGSLFLLVLLMGGLYIVWLILLFGAQMAYAFQNRAAYLQDRLADNVNQRGREFVALRVMTCLGHRFQNALPPATVPQLAAELEIPSRLTQSVLRTLTHSRLVTEIAGPDAAFVPSRPLPGITAYDILQAMRTGNGQELPPRQQPELAEIYGEFARIEQAERAAAAGISLFALVARAPKPAALPGTEPVPMGEEILQPAFVEEFEPAKPLPPEPTPEPPAEISAAGLPKKNPDRRDVVQPDEREFPL